MIPRFYDVTEGRILLDGTDIRNITLQSLRSAIGVVQQDVYLFSGTVYDNISYGKPDVYKRQVHGYSVAANVTDEDSVKNMIDRTVLAFGGLDVFVNNAGVVKARCV